MKDDSTMAVSAENKERTPKIKWSITDPHDRDELSVNKSVGTDGIFPLVIKQNALSLRQLYISSSCPSLQELFQKYGKTLVLSNTQKGIDIPCEP